MRVDECPATYQPIEANYFPLQLISAQTVNCSPQIAQCRSPMEMQGNVISMPTQSTSNSTQVDSPQIDSTQCKPRSANNRKRQPRYHVILLDDSDHSYDYVVLMMKQLFRLPIETGFKIAKEVDQAGRAICLTTSLEHAELKRDQIHAFGKDELVAQCKGSMSAMIEPAAE